MAGNTPFSLSWDQEDLFPGGVWGSAPRAFGENKRRWLSKPKPGTARNTPFSLSWEQEDLFPGGVWGSAPRTLGAKCTAGWRWQSTAHQNSPVADRAHGADRAPVADRAGMGEVALDEAKGVKVLADKIAGRALNRKERRAFVNECRAQAGDEEIYQQEYACEPIDEASAWLPWALITQCEREEAGEPAGYQGGACYVGMEFGHRGNLAMI